MWIAKSAAAVVAVALALAPLAPDLRSLGEVGPLAEAASYVNVAVPSSTNLSSGLLLFYSFDNTRFSTTTVTDESGNGKTGTPSVARAAVGGSSANVEALVVGGGGGGGGANFGGGGGAGGYVASSSMAVTAQAYTITVGDGGAGKAEASGDPGNNSVFGSITSIGGGGGAKSTLTGSSGGSGGGGANDTTSGGSGTAGQGNAGGTGAGDAGGGGGGAGGVGETAPSTNNGGDGGAGTANSISGASVTYAGGGGGSGRPSSGGSVGVGVGGGGNGSGYNTTSGTAGTANTGGGGGGGQSSWPGTNGGSGIVIISATIGVISNPTTAASCGAGCHTTAAGKDIWTFNSNGTWTPTIGGGSPATTAPLKVTGKIGSAIKFDGITASTTVGSVSASVKTVAFWTKVSTSTTAQNVMDLNGAGANIRIVSGTVTANGFTSPTIYVDGAVSSTLNNTNWHHVVITTGTNVNASNVSLGVASSTYYGGTLDDLRMYNRALSSAETKRLYQLGATSYVNVTVPANTKNSSGLVLQYSFDSTKFSTTTVTDESGNGKTGTPSVARAAGGSSVNVEALVVAGGGGGGCTRGGGGGAGGYNYQASQAVTAQAYTITVGDGGVNCVFNTSAATNGGDSSIGSIVTATGGGKGAGRSGGVAATGGSGGGGSESVGGGSSGAAGTAGQGNAGGNTGNTHGGGGGGASHAGYDGNVTVVGDGDGGAGTASSISGSSVTYAGGGGGGMYNTAYGRGGAGGGGNGGSGQFNAGANGTVNTGGGGGGGGDDADGGDGGSGIVIISATTGVITSATGGTFTQSGGKDIWTFTSSGTWTPTIPAGSAATKAPLKVTGKIGSAIKFDSVSASTTVGSVSSSVKTVAFWTKVSTSTTAQNVMDLNGAGANIRIVSGTVTANGFTSPTIYVDGAVSSTLNNTNWHHVVLTTGTNVNASNVSLGVASSTYFGGTLDDLRMYNRALSTAETKRLYQLGATSYINTAVPSNTKNSSGLVLQYSFDSTKFSTTTVTDESGNGKTGTNSRTGSGANTYATWSSVNKGSLVSLSGGDLVATSAAASHTAVMSTIGVSSGKWYWEYVLTTTSSGVDYFGVLTGFVDDWVGSTSNGWGYKASNGFKAHDGSQVAYGSSFGAGAVVGVALDMDAGTITFYLNNVSQGQAYSGLVGTFYAAVSMGSSGDVITANFGPTLTYSPPAGYNAGLYTTGAGTGNPPLKVAGKIGSAIKFDSISASTTVGSVSSSVKTVAFWTKVSTSTTAQNVMDLNGAGANIRIVSGTVTANGFTSPTIYVDGAVSSTLNNTNWHHVVITTGTNLNASNVSLGVASSTYYGGTLDDLRMYNRALSAAETKRLYQLGQ